MLNREFLERVEVAVVEADAPSSAADADATAVYRIRYRRFHMDFRDKAIVKFATEKVWWNGTRPYPASHLLLTLAVRRGDGYTGGVYVRPRLFCWSCSWL